MIIKKVADDHQIRIPDDVVDYIMATTSREVRALITCFHQMYHFSMAEKRRITLPLAREVREQTLAGRLL
jgi:chromosomal replication initiator protein